MLGGLTWCPNADSTLYGDPSSEEHGLELLIQDRSQEGASEGGW
jgi:hypothetical protein